LYCSSEHRELIIVFSTFTDDIRDKIIPDVYTDLLKGVISEYLAVGAACAVSLVELVAHSKLPRQCSILANTLNREFAGDSNKSGRC
jgi:hypothetical protein